MQKLGYIAIIILIHYSALSIQNLYAQTPINTPDNTGAGNCLDFDGTNDRVQIPHSTRLNITGALTVEGWVNLGTLAGGDRDCIYKSHATNASLRGYSVQVDAGGVVLFSVGNGPGTSRNARFTIPINEWHHFAGVYDGSNVMIYLDGVLQETTGGANLGSNTQPLYLGSFIDNNTFFDGKLDEVRIWNDVRTQAEIRDNMNRSLTGSEAGLAGYWNMNEGTGATVNDLTSNANHGTRQ